MVSGAARAVEAGRTPPGVVESSGEEASGVAGAAGFLLLERFFF